MNWIMILFSLIALAFSSSGVPLYAQSKSSQIIREGTFELGMGADTSFPYFTPEGERAWVPGWNPKPVFPSGPTVVFAPDSVFVIEGGEYLVWNILSADAKKRTADYIYFVAESRVERTVVHVEAIDSQHCRVHVRFVVTALSDAGRKSIEQRFAQETFAKWMDEWKQRVTAAHAAEKK